MSNIQTIVSDALAGHLDGPGPDIRLWPGDEARAYRDNGGFQAGRDAAAAIRLDRASARVAAALLAAGVILPDTDSTDTARTNPQEAL